jgi:SNF2 family DNA or RNA helicase
MTKEQERLYTQMEKDYITWLGSGEEVTAVNAAVRATKLMQISAGLLIDPNGEYHRVDHKHRILELESIYNEIPIKKLIIFANFTKSIEDLAKHFGPRAGVIDGGVGGQARANILNEFQRGGLEILIGQPRALSHSVTLHASNIIVWWSPTYSNETYTQCNGRIRRVGQTRPQTIVRFQSSKIERLVYKALEKKQNVSAALMDMYKSGV